MSCMLRLAALVLLLVLSRTAAAGTPLGSLFTSLPRQPLPALPLPALPKPPAAASPGLQCRAAIRAAEQQFAIPPGLMGAIGLIESGRPGPDGATDPWPWSINAAGSDHVFDTKPQAIAATQALQAAGVASIDVGCLQVNLMFHPDAFASLEEAFDPVRNARYAADFLVRLHAQTGSWLTATAWYHSATPELGGPYAQKVLAVLPQEQRLAAMPRPLPAMAANSVAGGGQALDHGPARLLPMAPGSVGRSLAAYRATPVLAIVPILAPPAPTILRPLR